MQENCTARIEDYVEAIHLLKRRDGIARISTISEMLDVTKPSASYAIKKLTEKGLVSHEDYGHVELTPRGLRLARKVTSKHELLLVFVADLLGVDRAKAEEEACKLEHALSDQTKEKLEGLVEFVLSDPKCERWIENLRYFQENRRRSSECLECMSKCVAVGHAAGDAADRAAGTDGSADGGSGSRR